MKNPFKRKPPQVVSLQRKAELEDPDFYGGDKTIHHNGQLDVETHNGRVVAVWFRCTTLPFQQVEVDSVRANQMIGYDEYEDNRPIRGIQFEQR